MCAHGSPPFLLSTFLCSNNVDKWAEQEEYLCKLSIMSEESINDKHHVVLEMF